MTDFSHFSALHVEEREDRVHARMDRPGVRNAIDQTMVDEFHELCAHLEREPKILIISGTQVESKREPGTFSGIFASGADIGQLRERRRLPHRHPGTEDGPARDESGDHGRCGRPVAAQGAGG